MLDAAKEVKDEALVFTAQCTLFQVKRNLLFVKILDIWAIFEIIFGQKFQHRKSRHVWEIMGIWQAYNIHTFSSIECMWTQEDLQYYQITVVVAKYVSW